MLETLRTARGVMRSLGIYYGWQQRGRPVAMDALYAHFVKPGDLVFDIGAHVGDRVAAFRRLGAKVVAVEPQRALNFVIGMMFSRDDCVVIERVAVGRKTGDVKLMINTDNPTISTASDAFINSAKDAPGWQGQHWDKSVRVPMTTLDSLIAKHGVPAFIKIDIEGFEEGADGADATGRGAVVRVHHHPAPRGAGLHQSLRGARDDAVQRRYWGEPDARRLAPGGADRTLAR